MPNLVLTSLLSIVMSIEICVPRPQDAAGGFTHEQHKRNYYAMYDAGIAYHNTHDLQQAKFIEEMLLQYADLYPTLGFHPYDKSPVPGRLLANPKRKCMAGAYSSSIC